MSFKILRSQNNQGEYKKKSLDYDPLHLKVQLLIHKLTKQPKNTQNTVINNHISRTKFSKVTFRMMSHQDSNQLMQIKLVKQEIQNHFQQQNMELRQCLTIYQEKCLQQVNRRQIKIKQIKKQLSNIQAILLKIKNIANDMIFNSRNFKANCLLKRKEKNKNYVEKTPNRQTFTPFQRDNSLLISVKRSMIDEANVNNSIKNSDKQLMMSNDYKFSQNFTNPQENPSLNNLQNKQKQTLYKDFIKQTEEDQNDQSFQIISSKIRYQFQNYLQLQDRKVQRCHKGIIENQAFIDTLGRKIQQQKKEYEVEWTAIQSEFQRQFASIYGLLHEQSLCRMSLYKDRQQMVDLLQQSFVNALMMQRQIGRRQQYQLIQNLSKMIQHLQ